VIWLLERVLPLAPDAPIRIYGNIDQAVQAAAPALFKRHAALFAGRVDDLDAVYAEASAILLPTLSGHGLSIKTVEAMSSGAPLVALRAAFRGIDLDPASLANVTLVEDATGFAAAVPAARRDRTPRDRSPTRLLFERLFGFDAYTRSLGRHAEAALRTCQPGVT
jgi:glycosyltransferase involved in cell wall biosynthesis